MNILVTHPCMSEFGWEVMEWQGYVREQANGCDRVVVCSRPAMKHLYEDIPGLRFIPHDIKANVTTHIMDKCHTPERYGRFVRLLDRYASAMRHRGHTVTRLHIPRSGERFGQDFEIDGQQDYRKLGIKRPRVVVHIRNKQYTEGSEPNYPVKLWKRIVARLKIEGLYPIAAVGTNTDALCLPLCEDYRDIGLDELCDVLASADIAIGTSSGPMHLASLCGCPHVVWTERSVTAERYRKGWNPFDVRCEALEQTPNSWLEPEAVMDAVRRVLDKPEPDQSRGVCYVSVGDQYHHYLEQSLHSLRLFYRGPATVLTDCECAYLSELSVKYRASILTVPTPDRMGQHNKSRWIKTSVYQYSPYTVTAYIDADTIICRNIDGLFDCVDEQNPVSMTVETNNETLAKRGWVQQTVTERDQTVYQCGADFPHYHTSTIVFQKSGDAERLFGLWHEEWKQFGEGRPYDMVQDQPSMARAASKTYTRIVPLPRKYNSRSRLDRRGDGLSFDTCIYSVRPCAGDFERDLPKTKQHVQSVHGIPPAVLETDTIVPKPARKIRRRGDR